MEDHHTLLYEYSQENFPTPNEVYLAKEGVRKDIRTWVGKAKESITNGTLRFSISPNELLSKEGADSAFAQDMAEELISYRGWKISIVNTDFAAQTVNYEVIPA